MAVSTPATYERAKVMAVSNPATYERAKVMAVSNPATYERAKATPVSIPRKHTQAQANRFHAKDLQHPHVASNPLLEKSHVIRTDRPHNNTQKH